MTTFLDCSVVGTGYSLGGFPPFVTGDGLVYHCPIAWSNTDFRTYKLNPGTDPITLTLQLLTSTGTASNGPFDVFEAGVGLGIPQSLIDITSFTDLTDPSKTYDYDLNQRVSFLISSPEPARSFIVDELCRPFGFYLAATNGGIIRCIRPRHPQKFYIGKSNGSVTIGLTPGGDTLRAPISIGVYTADELAAAISDVLRAYFAPQITTAQGTIQVGKNGNYCAYDSVAKTFVLYGPAFEVRPNEYNSIWATVGWTNTTTISGPSSAPGQRGALPVSISNLALSENDMWDVQVVDNRDDQILAVTYQFDFDVATDRFRSFLRFVDSAFVGISGPTALPDYSIRSRGLISSGKTTAPPLLVSERDTIDCGPVAHRPDPLYSVDGGGWAELYARSLMDRYRNPPLKFRARLKWKWNTLEVGDIVVVNYGIAGVFADFERNASVLQNRLFEIVEIHPSHDGYLDATFLGHRYVSY